MKTKNNIKLIISGGGSGGHVFPAIAIADAIKQQVANVDIHFVGAKDKIEMEKVPKAGYSITGLWISGFQRKLTMRNVLFPFKLIHSLMKAGGILRRFKPAVVVGVGGFASGPVLEMASRMGIPCLIQEQNSHAGITNKLLGNKVQKICVAYDGMEKYFPAQKLILTGNPVREDLLRSNVRPDQGIQHFDLQYGKKTILVFGGSLGARTINQAMAASTVLLAEQPEVQVLWQCGKLYIEDFKDCATAQLPNVTIQPFIDRMDLAYAMADLVICRAGALTISELCMLGKAAILVPSPNVAEDHQTKNALALVKEEAASMVADKEAKAQMVSTALELLADEKRRKKLSKQIAKLARPKAAEAIASEVLALIKEKN